MKTRNEMAPSGGGQAALSEQQTPETDFERVVRHAEAGEFETALGILRKATIDPQLRNALGVCNLRLGRVEEAVRIFRDLVLMAGGGWNKPHTPPIYKTNFATALLLSGHPCGAKELLGDVEDEKHPSVVRLRGVMREWERTLSLWQWINWKCFLLEPLNRPVKFDFSPGDFVDPQQQTAK